MCVHISVRLSEGANVSYGAVQIYDEYGKWSLVCDQGWTDTLARITCKQLGWSDGKAVPRSAFNVSQSDEMVYLRCGGQEQSLEDCESRVANKSQCAGGHFASVFCTNHTIQTAGMSTSILLYI